MMAEASELGTTTESRPKNGHRRKQPETNIVFHSTVFKLVFDPRTSGIHEDGKIEVASKVLSKQRSRRLELKVALPVQSEK
jgi:hypothetical protein